MIQHPLFLIIDGMSQAYRAYFAIKGLSTSKGLPTNAVYGFAIMLKRVLGNDATALFGPRGGEIFFNRLLFDRDTRERERWVRRTRAPRAR